MILNSQDAMAQARPLLIHVVARLHPTECGVSDFALAIAREHETEFGIASAFAIVNSDRLCEVTYPRIYRPQTQLLDACDSLSQGRPAALLVHLSGYGYSRDGAPTELAAALSRVRESGRFRVAVYFHELFATAMPWRSAFWYSHRQKKAIRTIAQLCDLSVTNTKGYADWLKREALHGNSAPVHRLPIFSNVGENAEVPSVRNRLPNMVVFGRPATRQWSYKRLSSLRSVLPGLGIKEILDIGPECDVPRKVGEIPVRQMGSVAADKLAGILSQARFGFVPHPRWSLAKSGVFAGFCALGAVPFVAEPFSQEVDGLRDGVQLVSARTVKAASSDGLEQCSAAAWRWYVDHRLHVHAATYARFLRQLPVESEPNLEAVARIGGV